MNSSSMAPIPPHPFQISHDRDKLDLDSIQVLVFTVEQHLNRLIADSNARKSLQLNCNSKLKLERQEFFEFSEHSVLSNFYWGVESFESAIQAEIPEERINHLKKSETLLQIPALVDENGSTGGIPNPYLVCCAYFYLSMVQLLRQDELQMTMYFLQAILVSPCCVRKEFAPDLCESLFLSQILREDQRMSSRRGLQWQRVDGFCDNWIDEVTRQQARRYKDWLMYCRVVLYGQTPRWLWERGVSHKHDEDEQRFLYKKSASTRSFGSVEKGNAQPTLEDVEMVHPMDLQEEQEENTTRTKSYMLNSDGQNNFLQLDNRSLLIKLDEVYDPEIKKNSRIKQLHNMLDTWSDTSMSIHSHIYSAEGSDSKEFFRDNKKSIPHTGGEILASEIGDGKVARGHVEISPTEGPIYLMHEEAYEVNRNYSFPSRFYSGIDDLNLSMLELLDMEDSHTFCNCKVEDKATRQRSPVHDFRHYDHNYSFSQLGHCGSSAMKKLKSNNSETKIPGNFENAVTTLCFSEGQGKCAVAEPEGSTVWEMMNNKTEAKFSLLKKVVLKQLLNVISTSKEEKVVNTSVSILSSLISENMSAVEDIRGKDLHLYELATALKRNVQEAAILIYLLNPSPSEIKSLELLPALVEVACNSNSYEGPISNPLTPTAASITMIEVLVTAFDCATNNMHLEAISSPQVLSKLVNIARNNNVEEGVCLAAILVRCMQFDGNCRNFLSQVTPMAPFIHLLRSNEGRAKFSALRFFHEILCIPRSSAISLLHQIRQLGKINIKHALMACIQQGQPQQRLLAANLLLQLDMLEDSCAKSVFREEAMEVLLESIASEESSETQILSAFILSNLGGTYAWTGEPYTAAWLIKKAGLTSSYHRHMIRNFDWSDQCLQDAGTDTWCGKISKHVIKKGNSIIHALEKGLQSKIRSVSRDCLITIAWLGCEISAVGPNCLKYSDHEILLSGVVRFLHPGSELEERILACLCLYNYASSKGMKMLTNFSEGLRESLRRLSSVTWMAEELLKVTDYFLPNKSRVSCVHAQIVEAGCIGSGAASALIYYKGQLYSGYSDGSIKVWDIKGQTAQLFCEVKEHKKAVTCFALFEPGDSLLSGSTDKSIRVWQLVERKLECVEVIEVKEPIHKIDTYNQLIFVITQSCGLKVCNASRTIQTICKSKRVKCLTVAQGKIYLGCTDSSIQEVDVMSDRKREIKKASKSWWLRKRPVNSILVYRDWVYCASANLEGSNFKEWRRCNGPQVSIAKTRGMNFKALAVVEDFIYMNGRSSPSTLQIWLRDQQKKVGRLSAGSKITSLLAANDIILCGTATGLIMGWIPL